MLSVGQLLDQLDDHRQQFLLRYFSPDDSMENGQNGGRKNAFYIPNVLFAHEVINLTGCFIWVWTSLWNTDDLLLEYHVMCEFQKKIWETTTLIAVPGHAPWISHEFEKMMLRKWNAMLHLLSVLVMVVPHFGPNWGNEITHAKLQQARAIRFHCRMHQSWAVDNF